MLGAPSGHRALPAWLVGLGGMVVGSMLGAATMALTDPVSGDKRRTRLQTKAGRLLASLRGRTCQHACTDVAAAPGATGYDAAAEEARLVARVRHLLARVSENARAIEVRLCDGVVELHGLVLRVEHRRVLRGVRRMYGVREVRNYLRPYDCHARVEDEHVVH